jgi:hypothetical protein
MNLFFIVLLFSISLKAAVYDFSTDNFQLGSWNPKAITYEQGLQKIDRLDKWFEGLPYEKKHESAGDYKLHRNRLFLVTQEKRLKAEVERTLSLKERLKDQLKDQFQPSWIAAGRNVLKKEKEKMYSDFVKMNKTALEDETSLESQFIGSLSDISGAGFTVQSGVDFAPSFSKSLSKTGGSMMGGSLMGGSMMDYNPRPFINVDPNKICKKNDKVCLKEVTEILYRPIEFRSIREILNGTYKPVVPDPVCKNSKKIGPSPGSKEFEAFLKKRNAFLKNVGSQNWKPKKTENDLSTWYSEPISQWSEGVPNAKCVGHAISSDIASVVNKSSIINYAISPNSTYAQIQVITREDLERKKKIGTITTDEVEILGEFQEVQVIDSNHAEFCNPSFYKIDDYLGALYSDNSLKYVFNAFQKRPVCGNRDLASNRGKNGTPLFTVNKFELLEFDKPSEQALDYDFFRQLIDTGNPPIVTIDSDARTESGDWLHIKADGELVHALNVVGYGEDIDPVTLCKVRYLKVRDSLGQKKIHYKVPADNFISHVVGVYKVTSVKKAN